MGVSGCYIESKKPIARNFAIMATEGRNKDCKYN